MYGREIVNKHHGYINVYSKVGEGTAFTIELPLDTPATGGLMGKNSSYPVYYDVLILKEYKRRKNDKNFSGGRFKRKPLSFRSFT
jgi:hypothetical protein